MIIKNNLRMDVREIISLYMYLQPSTKKFLPENTKRNTMSNVIVNLLEKKFRGNMELVKEASAKEKIRSELFLSDIIEHFRTIYSEYSKISMKETM